MKRFLPSELRLPTYLGLLLGLTSLLTFAVLTTIFLLTRIPQLENEIRIRAEGDAREQVLRIELQLGAVQDQLALLSEALARGAPLLPEGSRCRRPLLAHLRHAPCSGQCLEP